MAYGVRHWRLIHDAFSLFCPRRFRRHAKTLRSARGPRWPEVETLRSARGPQWTEVETLRSALGTSVDRG